MAKLARPERDSESSILEYEDADTPSKRHRIKSLGHHMKSVPKRLLMRLDVSERFDEQMEDDGTEIEGVTDNPAFNIGKVFKKQRHGTKLKTTDVLHKAARLIVHPKQTAKSETALHMAPGEDPYLEEHADAELLEAHDDLEKAKLNMDGTSGDESDCHDEIKRIEELEKERSRKRAAWMTSKHVKVVRVVPPFLIGYPTKEKFRELDAQGTFVRFQWDRWLGHYIDISNDLPYDRDVLFRHLERFLVATAPWQTGLMNVRKVYLWEDPWLTGRWLALYLTLIKAGYVMTFIWCLIVYLVLKRRYYPQAHGALRESHERAIDGGARAFKLSELIKRHGGDDWLGPLLEELGPVIQQQLCDTADFLEILINFYDWHNPRATTYVLNFFATLALFTSLTSVEFAIKAFWSVCGLYFFVSRPIASRYPRYRHVVSPFRWTFWQVPTHTESSFEELRASAQESRERMIGSKIGVKAKENSFHTPRQRRDSQQDIRVPVLTRTTPAGFSSNVSKNSSTFDSTTDVSHISATPASYLLEETDILSFRGRWESHAGRLIVTTSGVRFLRSAKLSPSQPGKHRDLWYRPFNELVEMRKVKTATSRKLVPGPTEALVFTWMDGREDAVESMRKRDECFNTVIGFSGLKFMGVQPLPVEEGRGGDRVTGKKWVMELDKHQGTLEK